MFYNTIYKHLFYYSGGLHMNLTAARPNMTKMITSTRVRSGTVYGLIIIMALIGFETFNFSTTVFALRDLLGDLKFAGIPWSTFLALAFCGIDFAGIARLINPENRTGDLKESWYLFGAWFLAATANAALTWWGVAVAISDHTLKSASVINTQTLVHIVPIFIAILVWVLRILIIASLTSAIERLTGSKKPVEKNVLYTHSAVKPSTPAQHRPVAASSAPLNLTRISKPVVQAKSEPTYHDLYAQRNFNANETHNVQTKNF
jgi:hypothetical protein